MIFLHYEVNSVVLTLVSIKSLALSNKNQQIMILNQNSTTEKYNESYAEDFINEGWIDINVQQPEDDERVLAIGDIEYETGLYTVKNPRRISMCVYSKERNQLYIADAEKYIPQLTHVRWWKKISF